MMMEVLVTTPELHLMPHAQAPTSSMPAHTRIHSQALTHSALHKRLRPQQLLLQRPQQLLLLAVMTTATTPTPQVVSALVAPARVNLKPQAIATGLRSHSQVVLAINSTMLEIH